MENYVVGKYLREEQAEYNTGGETPSQFDPPNYTQIPNALIALIPVMGESEMKVAFAIARKTFGWHKREDLLSYSQLEKLTGLSRQGVADGISEGMKRGTIVRREMGNSFVYALSVYDVDQSEQDSQQSRPQIVNKVDTQKKDKETNNTHTHTPEPPSEKEQCWNEVCELFPMGNAFDWEKWNNAWAMFPDKRRHDYAARRCRSANPRRFKFYLDDFMGFDPSKAVTWGDGKPAPIPKAPAKSPDPNRGIVTDEKRAELLREHQRLKALNKPQANTP